MAFVNFFKSHLLCDLHVLCMSGFNFMHVRNPTLLLLVMSGFGIWGIQIECFVLLLFSSLINIAKFSQI